MRKLIVAVTAAAACLTPSTAAHSAAAPRTATITCYLPAGPTDDTVTGACGIPIGRTTFTAAVSATVFDDYPGATSSPGRNPICGQEIEISYQGRTATIPIADRCEDCAENNLDLTPAAFDQLASTTVGQLHGATWEWANQERASAVFGAIKTVKPEGLGVGVA